MIISINAWHVLDKIQHLFMIKKKLYESLYRGNISQHNESYLWQTHSQYNTQWWKADSLPTKIWNETKMPTPTTSMQVVVEVLAMEIRQEKETKCIQIGREEVKIIIICRWYNIENSKDSTQKLLELINEFSKVEGDEINIQKQAAFLYSNSQISESECKQTIPFKTVPPK